jgi:CarD family transcriptional regulator
MDIFSVGDKVIYPNQGIGVVEDIQQSNLYGEESRIYHLRIISNDTLIMVPSASAEEIGIRKLSSQNKLQQLFHFLEDGMVHVTKNWKGRYKEHVELMKSGSILDVAMVLKSLYYLDTVKPLSFREKKMMEKAKELLIMEICEVVDCTPEESRRRVHAKLSACFENATPQMDS